MLNDYDPLGTAADNGITPGTTGEHCTEIWTVYKNVWPVLNPGTEVSTTAKFQKCVRIESTITRPFKTTDHDLVGAANFASEDSVDIDLEYRKYAISAGWAYTGTGGTAIATEAPGLQNFAAIEVDFGLFLEAPVTYTGALYGLQVAGSIVAITAMSVLF